MNIQILLYDGFDELDAIGPFETLRMAEAGGADLEVGLVVPANVQKQVVAQRGLTIVCREVLSIESPPDILLIPGGGWATRAEKGAWGEYQRGIIPDIIGQMYNAGVILASVCTGAMLIAKTGLLSGKRAVTHHNAMEDLRAAGAIITDARVVDEGTIITSGGITSGIDLALWIIKRFFGEALSKAVEDRLEYRSPGTVWQKKEG